MCPVNSDFLTDLQFHLYQEIENNLLPKSFDNQFEPNEVWAVPNTHFETGVYLYGKYFLLWMNSLNLIWIVCYIFSRNKSTKRFCLKIIFLKKMRWKQSKNLTRILITYKYGVKSKTFRIDWKFPSQESSVKWSKSVIYARLRVAFPVVFRKYSKYNN